MMINRELEKKRVDAKKKAPYTFAMHRRGDHFYLAGLNALTVDLPNSGTLQVIQTKKRRRETMVRNSGKLAAAGCASNICTRPRLYSYVQELRLTIDSCPAAHPTPRVGYTCRHRQAKSV